MNRLQTSDGDVVVVGQGVVGLVAAWRAARAGLQVTTLDPDAGGGATRAAAGMLAPGGEAAFGEEAVLALNIASAAAWPAFVAELAAEVDADVGYRRHATLQVAFSPDDARELDRHVELQRRLGLAPQVLGVAAAREVEPLLAPRVAAVVRHPDDAQVDPRRLASALREAARRAGVRHVARSVARLVSGTRGRVVGVVDDAGVIHRADVVVVAAGVSSGSVLDGLSDVAVPVRSVAGQVVRLETSRAPWLRGERVVRGLVQGRHVYVVGREDGEIVVGATSEERADEQVTAGGVFGLLRDARALLPGIDEAAVVELMCRRRPATPDHLPLVGWTHREGLFVAAGHHRHGVLQAAATAFALDDAFAGRPTSPTWRCADPARFVRAVGA